MAASFRVIIRNTSLDFEWKVAEILVKKRGISNQPDVCIFDDPCLSKFGALHGLCPQIMRQFRTFRVALCALPNKT